MSEKTDLIQDLMGDVARLRRENDRLWAWARRATDALTKVRPLGGSELFMRLGEQCVADPEWCGAAIEDLRESLHKARMENVRMLKSKAVD